jgi:hypothetical protein
MNEAERQVVEAARLWRAAGEKRNALGPHQTEHDKERQRQAVDKLSAAVRNYNAATQVRGEAGVDDD